MIIRQKTISTFQGKAKLDYRKKTRHKCSVEDIKAFTSQNIAGHNGVKTFLKPFEGEPEKPVPKEPVPQGPRPFFNPQFPRKYNLALGPRH